MRRVVQALLDANGKGAFCICRIRKCVGDDSIVKITIHRTSHGDKMNALMQLLIENKTAQLVLHYATVKHVREIFSKTISTKPIFFEDGHRKEHSGTLSSLWVLSLLGHADATTASNLITQFAKGEHIEEYQYISPFNELFPSLLFFNIKSEDMKRGLEECRQMMVAFAMGSHKRLSEGKGPSLVFVLDPMLVQMVLQEFFLLYTRKEFCLTQEDCWASIDKCRDLWDK